MLKNYFPVSPFCLGYKEVGLSHFDEFFSVFAPAPSEVYCCIIYTMLKKMLENVQSDCDTRKGLKSNFNC